MLHRRLKCDDSRGAGESLNEIGPDGQGLKVFKCAMLPSISWVTYITLTPSIYVCALHWSISSTCRQGSLTLLTLVHWRMLSWNISFTKLPCLTNHWHSIRRLIPLSTFSTFHSLVPLSDLSIELIFCNQVVADASFYLGDNSLPNFSLTGSQLPSSVTLTTLQSLGERGQ